MKIVILDGYTINPGDLSWKKVSDIADRFTVYDKTDPDDILRRIGDCDILMTSKCPITRDTLIKAPNLKYIGSTATGYNNIDIKAARELGIAVTNIPSYATEAVAQHAIAMMLELTNNVGAHNASVQRGEWTSSKYFCYWVKPVSLLAGKSLGIIGYGAIGRKTAEIAKALGMKINVYRRDPEATVKSDYLSLHCPLTKENTKMINREFLERMKPGAILINTARGALVDEEALAEALKSKHLAAAATDVLTTEPVSASCPLLGLDNCIITPHMAWTTLEMRSLIIDILAENLTDWVNGGTSNRVELKG